MKNKKYLILFFLLAFTVDVSAQKVESDSCRFTLSETFFQGEEIYDLGKPWKFNIGDDKKWAERNFDDSEWETSETKYFSHSELEQRKPSDIVWFRAQICIDSSGGKMPFAMRIINNGAMDFFWDGKLVKSYGSFEKDGKREYINPNAHLIINGDSAGTHTIAIRYENVDSSRKTMGFEVILGNPQSLFSNTLSQSLFRSILLGGIAFMFFTLFLIHLFSYLFYRKERSNLYFSIFNLGMTVVLFTWFLSFNEESVEKLNQQQLIIFVSALVATVFFSVTLNDLFGKIGWRFKTLLGLSVINAFLLLYPANNYNLFVSGLVLIVSLVSIEALFLLTRAIIRKNPGSRIIGSGLLFFFLVLIGTILYLVFSGGRLIVNPSENIGDMLVFILFVLFIFSIPFTFSTFLAWRSANNNKELHLQMEEVTKLSSEKQQILENQNEVLELQVNERTQELQIEKQKADDLLLNILPQEVAEELKEKGSSEAKNYDEVSVLFTDFVNFTQNSERIGAERMLKELNDCFTAFDLIMEKHGLEKIKTIGDAYMSVCGLPHKNENHAYHTVLAAMDIIDFIEKRKKENPDTLDIRIGVNSGSLIAGIVGVKKFAYDIWGDTVNTAARMEQNSLPGRINISGDTYELVKDKFTCESRGGLSVKGKGEMEMYFVNSSL